MGVKKFSKKIIGSVLLIVGGILIFTITIIRSVFRSVPAEMTSLAASTFLVNENSSDMPPQRSNQATNDYPIYISIPSLAVNAKIQKIGVAKNGRLAVPSNYTDVGWYKSGSFPGDSGSAVMDGHVDNGLGLAGVFKNLSDINIGDLISIKLRSGQTISFVTEKVDALPYNSTSTAEIFDSNGSPRLTIITCDGIWIPAKKTYDRRLIVTAIPAG